MDLHSQWRTPALQAPTPQEPREGDTPQPPAGEGDCWRCGVCRAWAETLFVLPCLHKFCHSCLHLWVGIYVDMYRGPQGRFPCQICWQTHALPEGGLQGFLLDQTLFQLQGGLGALSLARATREGMPQEGVPGSAGVSPVPDGAALLTPRLHNDYSNHVSIMPQSAGDVITHNTTIGSDVSESPPTARIVFDHFGSISMAQYQATAPAVASSHPSGARVSAMGPLVDSPAAMDSTSQGGKGGPEAGYCFRSCQLPMHMM